MRIILTLFAMALLQLPYLKLIGAALLLWIGVQLLLPEEDGGVIDGHDSLLAAIKTILIADVVMSLDNVLALAAVAGDSAILLVLGLAISIPLVIFGSTLLLKLMERFPVIVTAGAALLGFVAGEMAVSDPALADWMSANFQMLDKQPVLAGVGLGAIVGLCAALLVVLVGSWMARKSGAPSEVDEARESRK
jgi:YjbE family integral membrane protein